MQEKTTKIIANIKEYFYKIILITLFVMVIYATYYSVFNVYRQTQDLKAIVLIIGAIVVLAFFIALKKIINNLSLKYIKVISIILCIVFFGVMSIVGNIETSIPPTDLSMIIREANIMIENGGKFETEWYFAEYTNQTPLAIVIYGIYKLGLLLNLSTVSLNNFAAVINSLGIAISAYFTFLSVKKLKDEKAGLITLVFFIINPIFYLYSSYFYSDTLCMPFAMISIYLYICSFKETNNKKAVFLFIISGLILALGFEIRVVLGIFLIAMVLTIILKNERIKKKILYSGVIILGFILGIIFYNIISIPFGVLENQDLAFPITNWIMYSLNEESVGQWNGGDYAITHNEQTHKDKVDKNISIIKERLEKLGLTGWLTLAKEKLAVNWSNGDYEYLSKLENVEQITRLYEYIDGNRRVFIIYYLQICKVTVMLALAFSIIKEFSSNMYDSKYRFIYVSIFGAFLFYLVWEVRRRYSLAFLPIIMLLFTRGLDNIENKIEDTENNKKIVKKSGILIIILKIFLGAINFEKYTIRKQTYMDKIVVQAMDNNGNSIEKIAGKEVVQEFIANKKFNSITIKFLKQNTQEITHYYFVICDSDGKDLVKQSFNSDSVTNNYYKTFSFEYIKPNGNQKYSIKIYSEDATEENSIGIATYYGYGNYDIYPDGELNMDGETIEEDMTFKVQNVRDRTYISKKLYIIMFVIIIAIETFAFCVRIETNNSKQKKIKNN